MFRLPMIDSKVAVRQLNHLVLDVSPPFKITRDGRFLKFHATVQEVGDWFAHNGEPLYALRVRELQVQESKP